MKHLSYLFCFFFFAAGCSKAPQPHIQLQDFVDTTSVKILGQRLIDLPYGLNLLEPGEEEAKELFIGVHGGRSEGYEWIYPIKIIDTKKKEMYFYRWPDNGCFQDSAEKLITSIEGILEQRSELTKVTVIGHSYGGILLTHLLNNWKNPVTFDAHIIASPLQGNISLNTLCGYKPTINIGPMVNLYEWRTQQHLDSAFKDLPENPQNIFIEGSIVTELPNTYNGRRLGHNWSISWVAEKILK